MPNLKNYTSTVAVSTSIGRIERILVRNKARNIYKKYNDDEQLESIMFEVEVKGNLIAFKLPARVKQCFDVMWLEKKRPRAGTKQKLKEQSERTAWKIVCDWVEIQMSMIQLEQAEFMQIFLPYAYNPLTDTTFYEQVEKKGFKQLSYEGNK